MNSARFLCDSLRPLRFNFSRPRLGLQISEFGIPSLLRISIFGFRIWLRVIFASFCSIDPRFHISPQTFFRLPKSPSSR
jgi:hypothetical protein